MFPEMQQRYYPAEAGRRLGAMAQDVYARVITRHGINQFEIPVIVLDMLGESDVNKLRFEKPVGGEFMYLRPGTKTEHDIEKEEQQK